MDLHSKYPLNIETSNHRKDQDCECQHPLGNKVIFESSYGNFGPLDVTFTEDATLLTFNQAIASVAIDTTCVNVKNLLVEFTGILNVTTTVSAISTLTFTLFRICNDMRFPQPISTVNFFVADIDGGITASHTLAFRFPFRNDVCKDCCTYVLELTNISNLDLGTITYSINGTFSVLAIVSDR